MQLSILAVVNAESPACTINNTSGRVAANVRVKMVYRLEKDHTLPKGRLKSFTERLCGQLQLSGMGSTVKLSSLHQKGSSTIPVQANLPGKL